MIDFSEEPPEVPALSNGERPWLALEVVGLFEATGGLDTFDVIFVKPTGCEEPKEEFDWFCELLDDKGPREFCCDNVWFRL